MATLDEYGLTVRRQPEVLQDIISSLRSNVNSNIDVRDDEFIGQMASIIALIAANNEAVILSGFDNLDVRKAEGIWLDKLAADKGLTRQQETYSFTNFQRFDGENGSIVPQGTLVKSTVSNQEFSVDSEITLTTSSCIDATFSINSVENNTDYSITVNGTVYLYTSDASATESEILNGIKALIDADVTATWTATVNVATIVVATSDSSNINCSFTTLLTVDSVSHYARITATQSGVVSEQPNSITQFVSTIPGVNTTTNTQSIVEGRLREVDEEFRSRIIATRGDLEVPTLNGIYDKILKTDGVSYVSVIENATSVIDIDGRPPHSIEVIVQGGTDVDIGESLLTVKAGGIPTHGTITQIVTDSSGQDITIKFSRPQAINMAVEVDYSLYGEESPSDELEATIKSAVKAYIDASSLGLDVLPQRISAAVFNGTTGIESMTVSVQELVASGDTPVGGSWQTTPYAIAPAEYASIELVDVYVNLV